MNNAFPGRNLPVKTPRITIGLIVLCLLVFLYEIILSDRALAVFVDRWALVPIQFFINGSAEFSTPLTSLFIHLGWTHLFSNLFLLWITGTQIENRVGSWRFLAFFILGGLIANIVQALIEPGSPIAIVGASNAVAAILGALYADSMTPDIRPKVRIGLNHFPHLRLPVILLITFWFLIQILNGVTQVGQVQMQTGGVAFFSHIGGFVAGIVIFRRITSSETPIPPEQTYDFPTQ